MKVHLYAQAFSHGDGYIVADSEGLGAIRDACDAALKRGSAAFETASEDGEGYVLITLNLETRDPKWEQLPLPYTDGYFQGVSPFEILGVSRYRELHSKIRGT